MLISIHDKSMKRVAYIDNDKPDTLHFYDDTWTRYLTEATSTFDFTVPKAGQETLKYLTDKNYVSFRYENIDYLFNIIKIEETEQSIEVYTENLNLELINENAAAYTATQAMTLEQYLNEGSIVGGASLSDIVIGINEVSTYSRTLSWDSTSTKLARLLSIISQFDAECEFVTSLNRDGTMEKITLNVYRQHDDTNQGVGTRRSDVTLYYGKEISSIRRTVDKAELYTAILPTGKDNLGISSINRNVNDSNGKLLYSAPGTGIIYAVQSVNEYPAHLTSGGDPWTLLRWDYDTDDVETLYSKALSKLKSVSTPAITYEIEGTANLSIGDTIQIQDEKFNPVLILEARVSEQEICFTDPSKSKNTYSNFKALQNETSESIQNQLSSMIDEAAPCTASIYTDGPLSFKNGKGSVVLTVRVTKNKKIVTNDFTLKWYKDAVQIGTGTSITVNASKDDSTSLYRVEASTFGNVKAYAEVTITTVFDAATMYIHSSQGTSFKNDSLNTVLTVTIYYGSETIKDKSALTAAFGSGAYIEWSVRKFGDAGFTVISSDDSHITDNGFTYTVSASDVDTQAVFAVQLIT